MGPIALGVTNKVRHIENFPLGFVLRIEYGGSDKHVACEKGLPSGTGSHFYRKIVLTVLAYVQMLHKVIAIKSMGFNAVPQGIKSTCVKGFVDRSPINGVF